MILLSIVIVLIAVVAVSNGKISASKNHVFAYNVKLVGKFNNIKLQKYAKNVALSLLTMMIKRWFVDNFLSKKLPNNP